MLIGPKNTSEQEKKLQELLFPSTQSTLSLEDKQKKIIKLLEKHPELVSSRFPLYEERTFFHVAILQKLHRVCEFLVKHHHNMVTIADKSGQTACHYAIQYDDPDLLSSLSKSSILETQDNTGKSPLLLAVQQGKSWAIQILMLANANISLADKEKNTPFSLAKGKPEILKVLFTSSLQLTKDVFPPNHDRVPHKSDVKELSQEFSTLHLGPPPLKGPHSRRGSISGSAILKNGSPARFRKADPEPMIIKEDNSKKAESSSSYISIEMLDEGRLDLLENYLEKGNPNILIHAGRPLVMQSYIIASCPPDNDKPQTKAIKERQKEQFKRLVKTANLAGTDKMNRTIIDFFENNQDRKVALLMSAHEVLAQEMVVLRKNLYQEIEGFESRIEKCLYLAGLNRKTLFSTNAMPKTLNGTHENSHLLSLIWELCSGLQLKNEKGFNKPYFSQMIQGLLNISSSAVIFHILYEFWPHFDTTQKLFAVFICKEILVRDNFNLIMADSDLPLHFRLLKPLIEKDFSIQGEIINALFEAVFILRQRFNQNIVFKNYKTLVQWLTSEKCQPYFASFEELVLRSSHESSEEQSKTVNLIANELNMIMLQACQQIDCVELSLQAMKKKEELAPTLIKHSAIVNHLVNIIQKSILSSGDKETVTKHIKFFIKVAFHLCHPKDGLGPDMSSAIAIIAALNSNVVIRLKECFDNLDEDSRAKFNQVDQLLSLVNGSKWLRKMEEGHVAPIPHVGLMLTDLTKTEEANSGSESDTSDDSEMSSKIAENRRNRCFVLGKTVLSFLQIQKELLGFAWTFKTNLPIALFSLKPLTESELYGLSYKIHTPKLNLDVLSFSSFLDKFLECLNYEILPPIIYQKREYSPELSVEPVFTYFRNYLKTAQTEISFNDILRAKEILEKFLLLHNKLYPHAKNNYAGFLSELKSIAENYSPKGKTKIEDLSPPPLLLSAPFDPPKPQNGETTSDKKTQPSTGIKNALA